MNELAKAIMDRYNGAAGATLRGLVTGIYRGKAPAGATVPYIVFFFPAGSNDYTMGDAGTPAIHDITRCQFSVYDADPVVDADRATGGGPTRLSTIWSALTALYDFQHLTMDTMTMYQALRVGSREVPEPDQKGWALHVEYDYRTAA